MEKDIVITIPLSEKEVFLEILQKDDLKYDELESKNYDGLSEVVQIIIAVSTISIPVIGKILIESIKQKSKKSIKYNNIELTGLDIEEAKIILEKLLHK